ncbi:MAG: hypothetical protein ACFFCD_11880 [Promethearchaeota archaeon]
MSKERLKLKTKYLLENKEKLVRIKENMRIISLVSLVLPLVGFTAIATFIRQPSQWVWAWEPIVIITMLGSASFLHLLWIVVVRKGVEVEFKKDPLRGYTKWLRLPFFGAASLLWGIFCYFLLWEWTISFVFFTIYIFLFIIIFRFNKGFNNWMDKVLRVVEKKEKRLKERETRKKKKR